VALMGVARVCKEGYVTLQCKCGQAIHPGQPIVVEECTHTSHDTMRKAPPAALEIAGLLEPSLGRVLARNEASTLIPYSAEKRDLVKAAADQASNTWEPMVQRLVDSLVAPPLPAHMSWCSMVEDWGDEQKHCACRASLARTKVKEARAVLEEAKAMLERRA
jgi:hypothetical protein